MKSLTRKTIPKNKNLFLRIILEQKGVKSNCFGEDLSELKKLKENKFLIIILVQQIITKLLMYEEAIFFNFHYHFYFL